MYNIALGHDKDLIMFGDLVLSFKVIRAYPGPEFVVANTLEPKGKIWSQMKLTLAKVLARK